MSTKPGGQRLRVDVRLPLSRFVLEASFETGAPTLGLFGPSGAGKTSLLEAIAGLRPDATGTIALGERVWLDSAGGVRLPPEARGVGYVPQEALLFPHWDVRRNVLCGEGRRAGGGSPLAADAVISMLDLHALLDRRPASLSGGERRRAALARALLSGPALLLLDEPLGSLDAPLRSRILPYLLRLREEARIPIVHVSHDAGEVSALCEEVVVLRDGRAAAAGRPLDVFASPAASLGERPALDPAEYENVLEGRIVEAGGGLARVEIVEGISILAKAAPGAAPGSHAWVGVRAGEWMIALAPLAGVSARNDIAGVVSGVRPVEGGALVLVEAATGMPPIAVSVTSAAREALGLRAGSRVHLVAKAASCRILAVR